MKTPRSSSRAVAGRPRSEEARTAVLEAACDLFEEEGYPAATIEAIAARSGVAKTTIYRWWPNRAALMVELLLRIVGQTAPPPEGPDPMRALETELHRVARAAAALPGRLLQALLSEAQHDTEVRDALRKGLFDPRRSATAEMIRRAQESGALRRGVPPLVATDLFFGPLFYRKLIRQEPVTDAFLKQVYENVLRGLASKPHGPSRSTPRRAKRRPAGRELR